MASHAPIRSVFARAISVITATALLAGVLVGAQGSASAAEDLPPEGATLQGIVTDVATDAPVADITVEASGPDGTSQTVTGVDGSYTFAGLASGEYTVIFSDPAGGYLTDTRTAVGLIDGQVTVVDAVLSAHPNATLSGFVTAGGEPVVGIMVEVVDMELSQTYSTTTGPEGSYSVTGIAGAFARIIIATDARYLPYFGDTIAIGPDGATFDVELELAPTGIGTLTGLVRDRDTTQPIEGATVTLRLDGVGNWSVTTLSDADGRYSFADVPYGTIRLDAFRMAEPSLDLAGYDFTTIAVLVTPSQPDRIRDIRLRAVPTGSGQISGCVTTIDGEPVPWLTMGIDAVSGLPGWSGATVDTDELGCYVFQNLPAGQFRLYPFDFGLTYRALSDAESVVTLPASDAIVNRDLVLQPYVVGTASITGTLTDSRTGLPIENAVVILQPLDTGDRIRDTTTGPDGGWFFDQLPAGQYRYSIFDLENRFELGFGEDTIVRVAEGETVVVADTLTSVVAGTASLSGKVRDSVTHVGIAGATVSLARELGGYSVDPVVTDAAGNYRVEGLPAGLYYVQVSADGYRSADTGVELDTRAETLNLPIVASAEVGPGVGNISGVVTDPFGDPVEGAFVSAYAPTVGGLGGYRFASTDADGVFEFDALPLADWELDVQELASGGLAPGREVVELTADNPTASLSIQLRPASSISGMLDLSAIPAGARYALNVVAFDAITGRVLAQEPFDIDGSYTFDRLAAGQYMIQLQVSDALADEQTFAVAPVYWSASTPTGSPNREGASVITLAEGEALTGFDIRITEGASISGRVFVAVPGGTTGLAPTKSMEVTAYRLEGAEWVKFEAASGVASSFTGGRYQVSGLLPGSYRLEFTDFFQGSRSLATTYNGGGTVFDDAPIITVEAGDYLTARDVIVSMRRPDMPPSTVVLDDLGDTATALQGQIDVPEEASEGEEITVQIGEEFAGEWVSLWANSTPTRIGDWVQVGATGTVTVPLPAALVGEHRIAVQDAGEAVFGWDTITVVDAVDEPGDGGAGDPPPNGEPGGNSGSPSAPARPGVRADTPTPGAAPAVSGTTVQESPEEVGAEAPVPAKPEQASQNEALNAGDETGQSRWIWLVLGGIVLAALISAVVVIRRRRTV